MWRRRTSAKCSEPATSSTSKNKWRRNINKVKEAGIRSILKRLYRSAVKRISRLLNRLKSVLRTIWVFLDVRRFQPKKRTHFIINIAVGLAIVILLHYLQHTRWGENTLDKFFDLFIRSESNRAVGIQQDIQHAPILFVDIDHETYKQWGEPLITPRDKVARILQILHESEARVIVLDILLEGNDCLPENDRTLLGAIKEIQVDPKNKTKLILPQRIGFEGELKKNIFDDLVKLERLEDDSRAQKIYRATPALSATSSDSVVRYWNLFEKVRSTDGNDKIIWGYPVVAVMLAVEGSIQKLRIFEEMLRRGDGGHGKKYELLELSGGKTIKLPFDKSHLYLQRLRFLLVPEKLKNEVSAERDIDIEGNLFQTAVKFGELEYYKNVFKDKIVIVGNSSPDVGDIHRTPIGEMAGMYVLGNSINTILVKEQPSPSPAWLSIVIEICVIILAAYVFLYFTSLLAQIIASVVILLFFGYISYIYFLKAGVFLNFVFAIVGMGFHETIKDFEEIIEKRGLIEYNQKRNK